MEELTLDLVAKPPSKDAAHRFMAIGKVIAEKSLNRGTVKSIIRNIWPERTVPLIGDVATNVYSLTFTSQREMEEAIGENPWSIMGYCFNIKVWPPELSASEVDMSELSPAESGVKEKEPLVPGFWVPRDSGRRLWAEVKYEKLSDLCFNCGMLGHSNRFCKQPENPDSRYGPNLRAPPARKLLSPGRQRSNSWGGRSDRIQGGVEIPRVARALNFDKAREAGNRGEILLENNQETVSEKVGGVSANQEGLTQNPREDHSGRPMPSQQKGKEIIFKDIGEIFFTSIEHATAENIVGPISLRAESSGPSVVGSAVQEWQVHNEPTIPANRETHNQAFSGPIITEIEDGADLESAGVPELPFPESDYHVEMDSDDLPEASRASYNEVYRAPGSTQFISRRGSTLSPSRVIRTVLNLSNVFRCLNLKISAYDEEGWGGDIKRGRFTPLLLEVAGQTEITSPCIPPPCVGRRRKGKSVGRVWLSYNSHSATMIGLVWNYQGIGPALTMNVLKQLVSKIGPTIIFLSETKNKSEKLEVLRRKLGYNNAKYVEPVGKSGVDFDERRRLYERITDIVHIGELPIVCCGDFNDILCQEEKSGGNLKAKRKIDCFKDFVHGCNFIDMGFKGQQYAWFYRIGSDHSPILLDTCYSEEKAMRSFKFEAMWLESPDCEDVVKRGWSVPFEGSGCYQLVNKLKKSKNELIAWSKKAFPNNRKVIDELMTELVHLQNQKVEEQDVLAVQETMMKLKEAWDREEKGGRLGTVLDHIPTLVMEDMNQSLTKPFGSEEIREAAFQLGAHKAPGPDGFNGIFFQEFWDIVGETVTKATLGFFNGGFMLRELNSTCIVLIPKVNSPVEVTQYRPISLCNYAYKVISRVLVNRLKEWLPNLITENQNAFVAERQIHDNILIAQEVFHYIKLKNKEKKSVLALKLYMNKAYDRVEWDFLEAVMKKLGFCNQWVNWIMQCVSTVSYRLIINGKPYDVIQPSRGLRQGYPLSPYLFLFVADALSRMVQVVADNKELRGIKLSRECHVLTHILFADDSLFFLEAEGGSCRKMADIIESYGNASGQKVNFSKSSVIFSFKATDQVKADVANWLGIIKADNPGTYLGIPSLWGKTRREVMVVMRDRILNRLQGWKQKLLSQGGREILIKAVISAMPTYMMAIFKVGGFFKINMLSGPGCLKVGDGCDINIWRDRWIPLSDSGRVTTTQPIESAVPQRVVDIIDKESRSWKLDEISHLVSETTVEEVHKVPLSRSCMKDKLIWPKEKNGTYTVKSGYYTKKSSIPMRPQYSSSSSHVVDKKAWRFIWNVKAPPRVKHFLWRACVNGLATKLALKQRRIGHDATCPICHEMDQSVEHILLQCPWVETVWFGVLGLKVDRGSITSLDDWFLAVVSNMKGTREEIDQLGTKIAFTMWVIWKCRCENVFQNRVVDPFQCVQRSQNAIWNFIKTKTECASNKRKTCNASRVPEVWSPPNPHFLKFNCDGSFAVEGGKASIAVVVCNGDNGVLDGLAESTMANSALETEAKALLAAVKLVKSSNTHNAILEIDSEKFMGALSSVKKCRWEINTIIQDIRSLMCDSGTMKISLVRRTANSAADWVAKSVRLGECPDGWVLQPPLPLLHIYNKDIIPAPPDV
ncbi:reverse transcriptase [Corchorus capsularis]|uniref:Reverse transcriptase n=1 Tax=Corchorus capsularis TaxID=210143 RepID=A0A1R3J1H5_COCAP|nr:reverse transcriptase [Corchorus capsularis]